MCTLKPVICDGTVSRRTTYQHETCVSIVSDRYVSTTSRPPERGYQFKCYKLTFTKTIELLLVIRLRTVRCAPRKKRPTPRTHATLLTSSDLIGLNSARSHSADRSDADSNRQTPPAEWCPFGIASAPKAPLFASTAVDAASMRTSYPRSHTDVVLGGAADSAVLSMLSRSTSRVRAAAVPCT